MEERTGWRGQNESQRGEKKGQTCWCCQDHERASRMAKASAKKLEHTGPAEKERVALVAQREQLKVCQTRLCLKEKKQSHLSKTPDRNVEESQGERVPDLGK